jgi:predicted aspartyl protease
VKLGISLQIAAQVLLVSSQAVAAISVQTGSSAQPHAYDAESTPTNSDKVSPTAPLGELSFRLSDGYLISVEGQIGTQAHLKFILDTGASISMVDSKIADRLKLERHSTESFNFDRKLSWEQATFPEVRFGPNRATNIVMLVGHLAKYSEFARNADAIIGLDLLRLSNFTVDYDAREIIFHSLAQATAAPPSNPLSKFLFLEILVQSHPVRLIVDTGFAGILVFEERLRMSVPELAVTDTALNVTMGGRLHAKQTTLHGVVIGPTRGDVSVLLTKAPSTDMLPGIVGVVGITALNARRVNFNFQERSLTWE